jgi:hypothetical protein
MGVTHAATLYANSGHHHSSLTVMNP